MSPFSGGLVSFHVMSTLHFIEVFFLIFTNAWVIRYLLVNSFRTSFSRTLFTFKLVSLGFFRDCSVVKTFIKREHLLYRFLLAFYSIDISVFTDNRCFCFMKSTLITGATVMHFLPPSVFTCVNPLRSLQDILVKIWSIYYSFLSSVNTFSKMHRSSEVFSR